MKSQSFLHHILVESLIVITHHLLNQRQFRTLCLQHYQAAASLSSRTSTHLRHHHERMLISTEIRLVKHRIRIEDTHHRHLVEV